MVECYCDGGGSILHGPSEKCTGGPGRMAWEAENMSKPECECIVEEGYDYCPECEAGVCECLVHGPDGGGPPLCQHCLRPIMWDTHSSVYAHVNGGYFCDSTRQHSAQPAKKASKRTSPSLCHAEAPVAFCTLPKGHDGPHSIEDVNAFERGYEAGMADANSCRE